MSEKNAEQKPVVFRRIGGRVVPIRVTPTVNVGIGGQAPGATRGSRGPYRTKADRRNEQRRERYALRKKVAAENERSKKSQQLFGIKQFNIGHIAAGSATAATVTLAAFKGRKGILKMLTKAKPETASKMQEFARLRKGHSAKIGPLREELSSIRKQLGGFADNPLRRDINLVGLTRKKQKVTSAIGKEVTKAQKEADKFMRKNKKHFERRKKFKFIKASNKKYGPLLDYSLGATAGIGTYVSLQRSDN